MNTNNKDLSNAIRFLSMDAVQKANSGHPGMPMGMADVATILFKNFLKFSPKNPNWLNRDRFVLSAGHGSMLLYSLLYLTGYKSISLKDIKSFRQLNDLIHRFYLFSRLKYRNNTRNRTPDQDNKRRQITKTIFRFCN